MAQPPHSRIYHKLADEYPDIYDSPDLADYTRLLVAADQAWPTAARWRGLASVKAMARLVDAGLIIPVGARYRVLGLDKERARRSASASHAARYRHGTADGNAGRTADGNA